MRSVFDPCAIAAGTARTSSNAKNFLISLSSSTFGFHRAAHAGARDGPVERAVRHRSFRETAQPGHARLAPLRNAERHVLEADPAIEDARARKLVRQLRQDRLVS